LKVLMIGDIVGQPGRKALKGILEKTIREYGIDFVIANGENAAGGNGLTYAVAQELFDYGINVITMGNHTWDKREILSFIDSDNRILRPLNYPSGTPGKGWGIYELTNGEKIGVINILGRVFMNSYPDCPFKTVQEIIHIMNKETINIIIDFHGEATSEKNAFGFFVDGLVSAVFGTHTHVQTNDAKILPQGTAYITDVGMCGPLNSVLGLDPEIIIERFTTQMPVKHKLADGPLQFNATLVEINEINGMTKDIKNFFLLI